MPRVWRSGLLVACWFVLVACQPSVEPREPRDNEVTGRLVLVDDTGLPPRPAEGGELLLIPQESTTDLWASLPDGRPASLHTASVVTSEQTVTSLGGTRATVDRRGHFTISQSGPHLVCLLHQQGEPARSGSRTSGCAEVVLPSRGTLRATWGEAGFSAQVD